jgi:hypothetical protein
MLMVGVFHYGIHSTKCDARRRGSTEAHLAGRRNRSKLSIVECTQCGWQAIGDSAIQAIGDIIKGVGENIIMFCFTNIVAA